MVYETFPPHLKLSIFSKYVQISRLNWKFRTRNLTATAAICRNKKSVVRNTKFAEEITAAKQKFDNISSTPCLWTIPKCAHRWSFVFLFFFVGCARISKDWLKTNHLKSACNVHKIWYHQFMFVLMEFCSDSVNSMCKYCIKWEFRCSFFPPLLLLLFVITLNINKLLHGLFWRWTHGFLVVFLRLLLITYG